MEVRAESLQSQAGESLAWSGRHEEIRPPPRVRAVRETDAAVFRREDEEGSRHRGTLGGPDSERLKAVAERTQAFLDELNIRLDLELHETTGDIVIRIVNRETEELVRQIPPEELLRIHEKISELRGVLFDQKA